MSNSTEDEDDNISSGPTETQVLLPSSEAMEVAVHDPEQLETSQIFIEEFILFSYHVGGELFIHDADRQLFLECDSVYLRYRSNYSFYPHIVRMILEVLMKKTQSYRSRSGQSSHSQADFIHTSEETDSVIGVLTCSQCSQILGKEDSIFQVPGAAGTIGAYVNPHG